MKDFRVKYRDTDGQVQVTVCAYDEECANEEADRLEDQGATEVEIYECKPGIDPKELI